MSLQIIDTVNSQLYLNNSKSLSSLNEEEHIYLITCDSNNPHIATPSLSHENPPPCKLPSDHHPAPEDKYKPISSLYCICIIKLFISIIFYFVESSGNMLGLNKSTFLVVIRLLIKIKILCVRKMVNQLSLNQIKRRNVGIVGIYQ